MGDEYVVRTNERVLPPICTSAEKARRCASRWCGQRDFTVHKLGPSIPAPEPREWAVVTASGETFWSDGPLTRAEAERELGGAEISGRLGPYRLVRVIPEDGAL